MTIDQLIGQVLAGRYLIVNLLGEGGMGAVFKALDNQLQRNVAIKVMHPDLTREPKLQARFLREGQAMARLNHLGIVKVFDFGQAESFPFLTL